MSLCCLMLHIYLRHGGKIRLKLFEVEKKSARI